MVYCKHCGKDVESFRSWCSECGHNLADLDRLFINNENKNLSSNKEEKSSTKRESRIFDFLSVVGNDFFS